MENQKIHNFEFLNFTGNFSKRNNFAENDNSKFVKNPTLKYKKKSEE